MRITTVKPEGEPEVVHLKLEDENLVIEGDGIEVLINTRSRMLGKNLNIYPKTKEGLRVRIIFKEKDWAHPQKKPLDLKAFSHDGVDGIQFYREK